MIFTLRKKNMAWNKQYEIVNHRLVAVLANGLLRKLGK